MVRFGPASFLTLLSIVLTTHCVSPALAAWVANGNPVCDAISQQDPPIIVSDGAGGAIVAWRDARTGSSIFAQRIDASGATLWTIDGVAICTAPDKQRKPCIVTDGAGGAIIAWSDYRNDPYTSDVYAQRVGPSGAVEWATDGVEICTNASSQLSPAVVSDGAGGAIVFWEDYRDGLMEDIYAQRIDASGAVRWTVDGVVVVSTIGEQWYHSSVSDGAGGAIVAWADGRSGTRSEAYAQRIDSTGVAQWTVDGVDLCTGTGHEGDVVSASDGTGGAIVAWRDQRSDGGDIYAQRISAGGAVQWSAGGVPLCTHSDTQEYLTITPDGAGGAIVAWRDRRGGSRICYAQCVNASGEVQWTADGVALTSVQKADGLDPVIASDGDGGAIVAWGYGDIFAQRIDASGAVQWTAEGADICTATDLQSNPTATTDDSGGMIVAWLDYRGGIPNSDIYAQRVTHQGNIGTDPIAPLTGLVAVAGAAALCLLALKRLRSTKANPA